VGDAGDAATNNTQKKKTHLRRSDDTVHGAEHPIDPIAQHLVSPHGGSKQCETMSSQNAMLCNAVLFSSSFVSKSVSKQ
jgi:hypothetical protein